MTRHEVDEQGRGLPAVRRDRELLKLLLRAAGHDIEGVDYVGFFENEKPLSRVLLRKDGSLYVSSKLFGPVDEMVMMCALQDHDYPMTHKGHVYVSLDWLTREKPSDVQRAFHTATTLRVCRNLAAEAQAIADGAPLPAFPAQ